MNLYARGSVITERYKVASRPLLGVLGFARRARRSAAMYLSQEE